MLLCTDALFLISEVLLRQLGSQTYSRIRCRDKKHSQTITPFSDVWLILKFSAAQENNP